MKVVKALTPTPPPPTLHKGDHTQRAKVDKKYTRKEQKKEKDIKEKKRKEKKTTSPLKTQTSFFPNPEEEAAMAPIFLQPVK